MGEIEFSCITKDKLDFALLFSLANSLHSDDVHDPRPNILPHELLFCNVPVANTPNQNTKKATASRAEQFEGLFPLVKLFGTTGTAEIIATAEQSSLAQRAPAPE